MCAHLYVQQLWLPDLSVLSPEHLSGMTNATCDAGDVVT